MLVFFAMGLSMLQNILPISELPKDFAIQSIIYVAPTFRHTHLMGNK
jgi:hypothetical protein